MFKEILGIVINPILMLVRFRNETLQIVDFVRDYTLSHPELGYVCKFSVFELGLNPMMNSQRLSQLHTHCNEKKMEKSMFYFNRNASNGGGEPTSSDSNELFSKPVSQMSMMHTTTSTGTTMTPQQSFLETSVFGSNTQMIPTDSLMQGTLQNLNNAAFAPTIRPTTHHHQGLANSTIQNQQRLLQQSQFVSRNRNPGQQSVFLPSVLVRPSQPQEQQIAFNSGTLINDIEAQLEAEENDSIADVNMLDMFLGKK
jgi:hypothetical protein